MDEKMSEPKNTETKNAWTKKCADEKLHVGTYEKKIDEKNGKRKN